MTTLIGHSGPVDPYAGVTIGGDITLLEVIGAGAMGCVHRAHQRSVGRDVAVKILHREMLGRGDIARRFRREAKIASRLRHPHVVDVFAAGELPDGALYIVMELLRGTTLRDAMDAAGGALPLERALSIMGQLCEAVGEAHANGIVHRDLKPENVMLLERGERRDFVKVLDFGIAKASFSGQSASTVVGQVFGTARYVSPEGAQGAAVTAASDVYSLATMLYEMVSGRTPFESERVVTLLVKHVHEAPPPLDGHVPAALAEVIMTNLAKSPSHRAPHARAFAAALAPAPIPIAAPVALRAPSDPPPSAPPPVRSPRRRRLAAFASLAFFVGAGLAAATSALLPHHDARQALRTEARRALADGRLVGPCPDNLHDLVAAGLARWPDDPIFAELRSAGARELVTRSMVAHTGGDIQRARDTAARALVLDPSDRYADALVTRDDEELRALALGTARGSLPARVFFEVPRRAHANDTISIHGRVLAGTSGKVLVAKITFQPLGVAASNLAPPASIEVRPDADGSFDARLEAPAAGRFYVVLESAAGGKVLRADRRLDIDS